MDLYHNEVYMPDDYVDDAHIMMRRAHRAKPSRHVIEWLNGTGSSNSLRLKKHNYTLRDLKEALMHITRTLPDPFEIGVEDEEVIKYAVRMHLNAIDDITLVIDKNNVIRTAWLNKRDDVHSTLDANKYVQRR